MLWRNLFYSTIITQWELLTTIPHYKFSEGVLSHSTCTGTHSIIAGDIPDSTYGIDDEVPGSIDSEDGSVVVVPPSVNISPEQLEQLEWAIDPIQYDNQHGMALYIAAREFLHSHGIEWWYYIKKLKKKELYTIVVLL